MIQQIKVAPAMPSIDPTAPPIRVLSVALRIRVSKKIIEIASTPPMIAETSGFLVPRAGKGLRKYPALTSAAKKTVRIKVTSACI
jgi:hypothetical protein